jgi:hypothetical protein
MNYTPILALQSSERALYDTGDKWEYGTNVLVMLWESFERHSLHMADHPLSRWLLKILHDTSSQKVMHFLWAFRNLGTLGINHECNFRWG